MMRLRETRKSGKNLVHGMFVMIDPGERRKPTNVKIQGLKEEVAGP